MEFGMYYECRKCCVVGCAGRFPEKKVFRFPVEAARRSVWLSRLRLRPDFKVTSGKWVCEEHFSSSDILRCHLRRGACPSEFGVVENIIAGNQANNNIQGSEFAVAGSLQEADSTPSLNDVSRLSAENIAYGYQQQQINVGITNANEDDDLSPDKQALHEALHVYDCEIQPPQQQQQASQERQKLTVLEPLQQQQQASQERPNIIPNICIK